MTPSYAALPVETLKRIKDGFEAKDIPVKVMFAMRDPVARLRSHLKMEMAKGRVPARAEDVARALLRLARSVRAHAV